MNPRPYATLEEFKKSMENLVNRPEYKFAQLLDPDGTDRRSAIYLAVANKGYNVSTLDVMGVSLLTTTETLMGKSDEDIIGDIIGLKPATWEESPAIVAAWDADIRNKMVKDLTREEASLWLAAKLKETVDDERVNEKSKLRARVMCDAFNALDSLGLAWPSNFGDKQLEYCDLKMNDYPDITAKELASAYLERFPLLTWEEHLKP